MEFCKECGKPLKTKENIAKCSCGFSKASNPQVCSIERIKKSEKRGKGVAKKEQTKKGFPHECKKCGYQYSEVTDLGAPYSDEANVYLFKCLKCGYVEREAYGTGNK